MVRRGERRRINALGMFQRLALSTSASNAHKPSSSGTSSPESVQSQISTSGSTSTMSVERLPEEEDSTCVVLDGSCAAPSVVSPVAEEKLWSLDLLPVLTDNTSVKSVGTEEIEEPLGLAGAEEGVGKMYMDSSSFMFVHCSCIGSTRLAEVELRASETLLCVFCRVGTKYVAILQRPRNGQSSECEGWQTRTNPGESR